MSAPVRREEIFGPPCTHLTSSFPFSFAGTTAAKTALPGRQILGSLSTLVVVETVDNRFDEPNFGMCVRAARVSALRINLTCDMARDACSDVLRSVLKRCVWGHLCTRSFFSVAKKRKIYTRQAHVFHAQRIYVTLERLVATRYTSSRRVSVELAFLSAHFYLTRHPLVNHNADHRPLHRHHGQSKPLTNFIKD